MAFLSGKTGEVVAGAVTLNVTSWTADMAADMHETTHSGSAGFKTFVVGTQGMTGTVELNWDSSTDLMATVPAITPGTDIGALKLYLEAGQGYLTATIALVNSCSMSTPNDGVVTYSIGYTITGSFDLTNVGTW